MVSISSQWNQDEAEELIGKSVLIGITYTEGEKVTKREQLYGVVKAVSREEGILVSLKGANDGRDYNLPPRHDLFNPADAGVYQLQGSDEVVENPDYTVIWRVKKPIKN